MISFLPPSTSFGPISIFIFCQHFLQMSSKQELEIVIVNHLVFNWVLINIYGLRSYLLLRISGR